MAFRIIETCIGCTACVKRCPTDAITGDVAVWAGAIVTTYVGGRSLEKIAKSISTIWSRK